MIKDWIKEEQAKHRLCACGCGKEIIIKEPHHWRGIPQYISGHNQKDKIFSEETRKRMRASNAKKLHDWRINNKAWLFEKYINERLSCKEIANIIGCGTTIIKCRLRDYSIKTRSNSDRVKYPKLRDKDWLIRQYQNEKMTATAIAKIINCNVQTVCKVLKMFNIPIENHRIFPTHHTKPELIFEQICKKHNLGFHFVGDGQLWIGKGEKMNPDFIEANGKKICVEIMGAYWHSPLVNSKVKERYTLSYREKHYKKYKWQPIFIWESDLLRKDAEQFVLNTLSEAQR